MDGGRVIRGQRFSRDLHQDDPAVSTLRGGRGRRRAREALSCPRFKSRQPHQHFTMIFTFAFTSTSTLPLTSDLTSKHPSLTVAFTTKT